MRHHRLDLATFCLELDPDEYLIRKFCQQLASHLFPPPNNARRLIPFTSLRGTVDGIVADNKVSIGVGTASEMYAILDLLEAVVLHSPPEMQTLICGYVGQFGLSDRQFRKFLRAMMRNGILPRDDRNHTRAPAAYLPAIAITALYDNGQLDAMRALYHVIGCRIHQRRKTVQRNSQTHDEWLRDLAALAIALVERKVVPVTETGLGIGRWNPGIENLFSANQLTTLRRDEAFFAEQFAHLLSLIAVGGHHSEALLRLSEDPSFDRPADRLVARQRLRLMRARYEIPPYLFSELDNKLAS